jgi:hypothetical protein
MQSDFGGEDGQKFALSPLEDQLGRDEAIHAVHDADLTGTAANRKPGKNRFQDCGFLCRHLDVRHDSSFFQREGSAR